MDNNFNDENSTEKVTAPADEADVSSCQNGVTAGEAAGYSKQDIHGIRKKISFVGFALLFYVLGVQIVGSILFEFLYLLLYKFVDIDTLNLISGLAAMYFVSVPVLFAVMRKRESIPPEKHPMSAGQFIPMIFIGIAIMTLGGIIGDNFGSLIGIFVGSPVENAVDTMLSGTTLYINCIYATILAPIFEELIYRKMLLDRTQAYGQLPAAFLSALLFGLMHTNIYQFFYAFGLGLLLSIIYIKTGKIHLTIAIHAIINLLQGTLPALLFRNLDTKAMIEASNNAETWEAFLSEGNNYLLANLYNLYGTVLELAFIAGIVIFFVNLKKFKLEKTPTDLPAGTKIKTLFFNPGVIVFSIVTILLWVVTLFI